MNNEKQQNEAVEVIAIETLDEVTGGIWPAVGIGVAVGAAIWTAGHSKGVAENSCA